MWMEKSRSTRFERCFSHNSKGSKKKIYKLIRSHNLFSCRE